MTLITRRPSFLLGHVFLRPGSFWTKRCYRSRPVTAVRRAVARLPLRYLRRVAAVGELEAGTVGGSHGAVVRWVLPPGGVPRRCLPDALRAEPAVIPNARSQAALGAAPRRRRGRGKMAASWWRSGGAGVLRLLRGGRPVPGAGLALPARGGWRLLHGTQELLGECWAAAGLPLCGQRGASVGRSRATLLDRTGATGVWGCEARGVNAGRKEQFRPTAH